MPGHRSKKRIGTFQKKGRPMKQNSSNTSSLDESSVVSDKSTNTDSISTAERSTMTTNSNPTVQRFMYSTQAIRTTRSLSLGSCSNIQKRRLFHDVQELSEPLRKKPRRQ
uniref:Uncharacterized protein n=1 Tax=Amphimedon queenslandica TaxID=400682 RepID=A0A1X7TPV4_AMPQE